MTLFSKRIFQKPSSQIIIVIFLSRQLGEEGVRGSVPAWLLERLVLGILAWACSPASASLSHPPPPSSSGRVLGFLLEHGFKARCVFSPSPNTGLPGWDSFFDCQPRGTQKAFLLPLLPKLFPEQPCSADFLCRMTSCSN